MIRTQIQLTEKQSRKIRARAREKKVSLAEAIRQCIDESLVDGGRDRTALFERAERIVGTFKDRSGASDLSSRHDRYLAKAFE
ncbi:MAG TPA: CopG family transcriptional regulator [Thermoanaerobaculia bacterium]|nr:CopG family transcriptional regulator [Thermoanaerobaculia bacterium]